ncbi:septum formation initiator family protein (plasmid) [Pseudomonas silesiensis]|uniref:septum formation initiator family protein n=1 Tax=Pseudomonas silesiensis TaxID=1853130 RepID=UPI0030CB2D87
MRSTNWLFVILLVIFGYLQHRLWSGDGSYQSAKALEVKIAQQRVENDKLLERNRVLDAEVDELKSGMETVEERARHELGMIKEGETLYMIIR